MNIFWIYYGSLHNDLDAATWLEVTRHLRKAGHQVVLVHAGPEELESVKGVEVTSISKPDIYLVRQAVYHLRVWRELAKYWNTADVVLFHNMSVPWMLPLRILRGGLRENKPLFVKDTRTAPMIPREVATARDRIRTVFDNTIDRTAGAVTDGQTAITTRMAKMMHIPADQLLGVWPSGVDLEQFSATRELRDWTAVDQNVHIIYIGAMHYQRNLMNFCKAVELANQHLARFSFTMIGSGTEFDDLRTFAARTDGRIRVLPPVAHDQVPDLLAGAHIGVLPFPDQERFRVSSPIKLFEYMASGLPILATHIPCHTDVVGDGHYAFWAYDETASGLLRALEVVWEQRNSLPEMGLEAAEAAGFWTWNQSAQKLSKALQQGFS